MSNKHGMEIPVWVFLKSSDTVVVPLLNNGSGCGVIGENWHTGVFIDLLLEGDFKLVLKGAISGMSIVNGVNNEGL